MKEIKSAFGYYYGVCESMSYSLRYRIILKENVDEEALLKSVQKTMQRYRYLKLKMVRKGNEVYLDDNPLKLTVKHSSDSVLPGSQEANGHLISFNWYEKYICINMFHGLTDGKGLIEISKTLLYYYCEEKHDFKGTIEGIKLLEDLYNPLEYTDPMLVERVSHEMAVEPKKKKEQKKKSLNLNKEFNDKEAYHFYLKIPESELMDFCRRNDASPNTFFSVVLARAIHSLNKDNKEEIVERICVDQRPALQMNDSLMSLVSTAVISFPEKFFAYDFNMQCTIFRGKLMIATDSDLIGKKIEGTYKFYDLMSKIPSIGLKRKLMGSLVKSTVSKDTFGVSYSGPTYLGELDKYIDAAFVETEPTYLGLEISAVAGNFDIVITQPWKDEKYYRAILDELDSLNVNYTVVDLPVQNLKQFKYPV